jgi:hypothetical protein
MWARRPRLKGRVPAQCRRDRAGRQSTGDGVGRRHRRCAAERDVERLLLHQHDGTHDGFASQLLAIGQGLHVEVALGLLQVLLVEVGSEHMILGSSLSAYALLRLDPALVRRHVLRQLPRLGLFL